MKVTVVPIEIHALGTIPKGLVTELEDLEIKGQVETIQTTVLLRSARIFRKLEETGCHSNSREKPSPIAGMKE